MENAVDVLKMAFGIFVFVLAIALTVAVIGQARATSDVIFHMNDKTEFYQYIKDGDVNAEDRIVGINVVIPTIHRYMQADIAVSIYNENGIPIARFDLWTEGFMNNWDTIVEHKNDINSDSYKQIKNRLERIQEVVNKTVKKDNQKIDVEDIIKKFYSVTSDYSSTKHGAPWIGNTTKIFERIKADMVRRFC